MSETIYTSNNFPVQKNHNKRNILILVGIFLILVAGVLIPLSMKTASDASTIIQGTDSGVAACKQIAVNMKSTVSTPDDKMTPAVRDSKKSPFVHSRYADLKVAGSNVIDTVYRMDNSADTNSLGGGLADLTLVVNAWSSLQVACANHGADIPALG